MQGAVLTFDPGFDRATRARILNLRQAEFKGHNDYLFGLRAGLHPAEDEFDADSFHFSCTIAGEVVAACRYSPPRNGLWEASRLCTLASEVREATEPPLQIGRVVVRRDLRSMRITEVMLCLACRWLLEHTSFTWYFALCRPQLAEYYLHFGAETLPDEDVVLLARNNERYRFVQGRLARSSVVIADFLSNDGRHAWSLPEDPDSVLCPSH